MSAAILISMGHTSEEAISLLTTARKVADPRRWYIRRQIMAFEKYWQKCELLSHGPLRTKLIDVGQFNNRYFITGISIGFSADLVKGANRDSKNKFDILAYFFATAAALKKLKPSHYHIKIDGNEYEVQGLTCMVNNAGNLGFTKISLDKHIDVSDGLLDVVVVRKANLSLLKLIVITLIKRERPDNFELVEHWQGREISISSSRQQVIQCDGEVLEKIPSHIKIIPGAIKVLVPIRETKPFS
jgi:diacylglycerol kinase (ATP)